MKFTGLDFFSINEHGCILTASECDYILVNGAKFILEPNCNYLYCLL